MTTTTTTDGPTVHSKPRETWERPSFSSIAIHRIDPGQDVRVGVAGDVPTVTLGDMWAAVVIHGDGPDAAAGLANLAAIGRAITAQAEQALADPTLFVQGTVDRDGTVA